VTPAVASATFTGTTAVTCKSTPSTGFFSDAHCTTKSTGGNYSHETIGNGKSTELAVTNSSTCEETKAACPLKLKTTIAGVPLEITVAKISGSGSIQNSLVGEEHQTTATTALLFEEATVTLPAGKGCQVEGGKFTSSELSLSTGAQGMSVSVAPTAGETITSFTVKSCSVGALNNEYLLKGSFKGAPSGATLGFTEAATTEPFLLRLFGQKAGIDGQLTFTARANSGESYTPLATTTTGEATKEEEKRFRATQYSATLSGNQAVQHALSVGTKEIECTEAAFPGTLSGESTTLTLSPEYKSCRTELSLPTTVTMNGCSFVLNRIGKTSISCPAGKKIQYHVYETEKKHLANEALCTYSIPPQHPTGEVVYEPEGSGSTADLLIKYKVTGITYEVEGPKLQCGSSASNGEYTGNSTETAKNEKGEQIGLFIE
jgi:hypothetical protein